MQRWVSLVGIKTGTERRSLAYGEVLMVAPIVLTLQQRERENEREREGERVSEREIERERFYWVVIWQGQSLPG